ncbi:hypothetical protein BS17DRAFT_702309, partial [Gyrodon lividus]
LQDLVECQPDIMLCEMQEYLCQIYHIHAPQATLMETLHHQGLTREKVLSILLLRYLGLILYR